jgi:hypothetical protein
MNHRSLVAVLTLMAVSFGACSNGGPADPGPGAGGVEPGVLKGVVLDSQGRPVAGAKVFADHTLYYDTNAIGVTDAGGRYRIDVRNPPGGWHATAQLERQYNGQRLGFDLDADDDAPFGGATGAVRNFTWKLSGRRHDGGDYGSKVIAYRDLVGAADLEARFVELTLEPVGPLVDGSEGRTITARLENTPDGDAVPDVPVGRYRVTARYAPDGEAASALTVRPRNTGAYAASVTVDFKPLTSTILRVELDVNRP